MVDKSAFIKIKHDNTDIVWNYVLEGQEHILAEAFLTVISIAPL